MTTRFPRPALFALAGAVAVAAVAFGVGVTTRGTGNASPSPAIVTPTPLPSITADGPLSLRGSAWDQSRFGSAYPGTIPPGRYFLEDHYPARISFDIPAGWFLWDAATDYNGILVDSPGAPSGSGWGVVFSVVGTVSADPCNQFKGTLDPAVARSVDAVAAAMAGWPGFEATSSTAITVDGHPARLVMLTSSHDSSTCPTRKLWTTPAGGYWEDAYGAIGAERHVIPYRLVQVGDAVLVIRTTDFPETSPFELEQGVPAEAERHAWDQVALAKIVDSVRIEMR